VDEGPRDLVTLLATHRAASRGFRMWFSAPTCTQG
jgi:hypothetical protein